MIGSALRHLAGSIGKSAGRKVQRDLTKTQELNVVKNWTHRDKIKELSEDSYLAPDYIKSLIANSKKSGELKAVKEYLANPSKTDNLPPGVLTQLKRSLGEKLEHVELKEVVELLKEALL